MSSIHTITIQDGPQSGLIISISAVTRLTEMFSGKPTDNPVANRTSVSDHYIIENPRYSFSGVISGVINPRDNTVQDSSATVSDLKSTIEGARLVTFFSGQNISVKDCFVENITLTRTKDEGVLGWKIDCKLKKINIAIGGTETLVNIIPDQSSNKTEISSSSTKDKGKILQLEGTDIFLSSFSATGV